LLLIFQHILQACPTSWFSLIHCGGS
jgi:hypothetical protein